MFCTYLTTYHGNKLPPFYVGSSSVSRIEKGYKGSIRSKEFSEIWKREVRNNAHLFKVKIISFHKTRIEAYEKEESIHRQLGVATNPLYANRSIALGNGTFGAGFAGKKHTREHREYMSKKMKGRKLPWLKGKKRPEHSLRMLGTNNPNFGKRCKRERTDKFCCLFCKRETIVSNLKHHMEC